MDTVAGPWMSSFLLSDSRPVAVVNAKCESDEVLKYSSTTCANKSQQMADMSIVLRVDTHHFDQDTCLSNLALELALESVPHQRLLEFKW